MRRAHPDRLSNAAGSLMEALERRLVLADFHWSGGTNGDGTNWFDAANWVQNAVPGTGDDAFLGPTGTNPTINLFGNETVRSVTLGRNLVIRGTLATTSGIGIAAGSTLSLGDGSGTGQLSFTSGTQVLGGTGLISVFSGTIQTSGSAAVTIGSGLTVSPQAGRSLNITVNSGSSLTNEGTIVSGGANADIDINNNSGTFVTTGSIIADGAGSQLTLNGTHDPDNLLGVLDRTNGAAMVLNCNLTSGVLGGYTGPRFDTGGGSRTYTGVVMDRSPNILASITVAGGLTVNDTMTLGNANNFGQLSFTSGTQVLGGMGTISVFSGTIQTSGSAAVTIGSGLTVSPQAGRSLNITVNSGSSLTNEGTIVSGGANADIDINNNSGTFVTTGSIIADGAGSQLTLNGTHDPDNLLGVLDRTNGAAMVLNCNLTSGVLGGYTGPRFDTGASSRTYTGVVMERSPNILASITIVNGLTVNDTMTMGNANNFAQLSFTSGTQVLGGTGLISVFSGTIQTSGSAAVTIGSGLTVSPQAGRSLNITVNSGSSLTNEGTIVSGGANADIDINNNSGTFVTTGSIIADGAGSQLTLNGTHDPDNLLGILDRTNGAAMVLNCNLTSGVLGGYTGPRFDTGASSRTYTGVVMERSPNILASITVAGGLTVNDTMTLGNANNFGQLSFTSGTQVLGGMGTISVFSGTIQTSGSAAVTIGSGLTVSPQAGRSLNITVNSGSSLTNEGTIVSGGANADITITGSGTFRSSGRLGTEGAGSVLSIAAGTAFASLSAGILTEGTYAAIAGGIIDLGAGRNVTTIGAATEIAIDGTASNVTGVGAVAVLDGTLELVGGKDLSITPAGGTFTNNGSASLRLGAGSTLAITGSYIQTAAGALVADISGTDINAQIGRVSATGAATLGGSLVAAYVNNYTPAEGSFHGIVAATGGVNGAFASTTLPAVPAGDKTVLKYEPTAVRILSTDLADFDENGTLDIFDFLEFQNLWAASDPRADLDTTTGPGVFDIFDFLVFFNLFGDG